MILFLDFDGVLHPDAAYLEKGRPVLRAEGEFFMWSPHLVEALDPHPKVKIVLSTSWVRLRGFTRAREALPEALRKRIIGATWHSSMQGGGWYGGSRPALTRYQEIAGYVHRAQLKRWIALDDDAEGWAESASGNLIQTDPDKGISDPDTITRLKDKLEC